MTKQEYNKQQTEHCGGQNKLRLWQTKLPPQLSDAQSLALLKEYKLTKNLGLVKQVVSGNLRAVAAFCKENNFVDEDDFQQGALVATEAAKAFNPARGEKFSTYLWCRLEKTFANDNNLTPESPNFESDKIINISTYLQHDEFEDETFSDFGKTQDNILNILDVDLVANKIFPSLPIKQRKMAFAYYFCGMSLEEVGVHFKCSRQRVYEILAEVKGTVRQYYQYGVPKNIQFQGDLIARNGARFPAQRVNGVLKNFKLRDQCVFFDYYQKHISVQEIAKKYDISVHYANVIISQIYLAITNAKRGASVYRKNSAVAAEKPKVVFVKDGKKFSYNSLKKFLPLFDLYDQKIFTDYFKNNFTQADIAQKFNIPVFEVFTTLKTMQQRLFLIEKEGLEKALEILRKAKYVPVATLYKISGKNLSVVNVDKFWRKLSPKEKDTFKEVVFKSKSKQENAIKQE